MLCQIALQEDVVIEQSGVVVDADESEGLRLALPVGERVPERLHIRPDHEDQIQRQGCQKKPCDEPVLPFSHGVLSLVFRGAAG